jgi:hypothetical protein
MNCRTYTALHVVHPASRTMVVASVPLSDLQLSSLLGGHITFKGTQAASIYVALRVTGRDRTAQACRRQWSCSTGQTFVCGVPRIPPKLVSIEPSAGVAASYHKVARAVREHFRVTQHFHLKSYYSNLTTTFQWECLAGEVALKSSSLSIVSKGDSSLQQYPSDNVSSILISSESSCNEVDKT